MKLNEWITTCLWIKLVFFLLVLCIGCAGKEEKSAKHLERARQYIEKTEYRKAVIEFKNVVQLDPENDTAQYELGETYLKLKRGSEAFRSFERAVSINPKNLKAQLKLGQILLLGKRTEDARKKADLVLEKSSDNIDALVLLSGACIQKKNLNEAIKTLEKAASIDPDHFITQLSLARVFVLKGEHGQAEKAYLKALSLEPASRLAHIELSRLYSRQGEWDKAESELKKMVQTSRTKHQALYVLALFYETQGKWGQAEKIYLEAVDSAPKADVASLMNLGAYYSRRKSYDKALTVMEKASEINKDDLNILVNIAQIYFNLKKMKDADNTVDKILDKDKQHMRATFLKGRLDLLRKDFVNALERFNLVVRESPQNAMAHYFRALCLLGKGDRKLAEQDLLKAVELNPRLLEPRLILADFYLREMNQDLARQQIEPALKLAPRHVRVLMLKGNLKILERDPKGAELAFKQVIEQASDYAPGHVRLGLLYNLSGQQGKALIHLKKALEVNPQQTDALALIVGIHIREKKYDKAFQICENQKQKKGNNPSQLALIEYLEGNISLARKDSKRARKHFEKAIDTDPYTLPPYVALARLCIQEGKPDEAISQFKTVLNKNPKYLAGYIALGTIYDQQGEWDKAEACYRNALEIKSDFAPAANNLAWNLAKSGGNIDEALGFAQIAKEQMPKNPAVMDTLGWIYYLKGIYMNAISEFQDSLALDPNNPLINYHLGLAYYKNSRPDAAKEFLEKALKIDKDFEGAKESRNILKNIRSSTAPD